MDPKETKGKKKERSRNACMSHSVEEEREEDALLNSEQTPGRKILTELEPRPTEELKNSRTEHQMTDVPMNGLVPFLVALNEWDGWNLSSLSLMGCGTNANALFCN